MKISKEDEEELIFDKYLVNSLYSKIESFEGVTKMEKQKQTMREMAMEYEGKTTKNIADLKKFNSTIDIELFEGQTEDGKEFSYHFITVEGEQYRVPNSVLAQMKVLLEDNSEIIEFKVKKSGEGLKTVYTVIAV